MADIRRCRTCGGTGRVHAVTVTVRPDDPPGILGVANEDSREERCDACGGTGSEATSPPRVHHGHHVRLVLGVPHEPEGFSWDEMDPGEIPAGATPAVSDSFPEVAKMADTFWIGFGVADTRPNHARERDLLLRYVALPLGDIETWCEHHTPAGLAWARERWAAWRQRFPAFPEGRLMLVAEYS